MIEADDPRIPAGEPPSTTELRVAPPPANGSIARSRASFIQPPLRLLQLIGKYSFEMFAVVASKKGSLVADPLGDYLFSVSSPTDTPTTSVIPKDQVLLLPVAADIAPRLVPGGRGYIDGYLRPSSPDQISNCDIIDVARGGDNQPCALVYFTGGRLPPKVTPLRPPPASPPSPQPHVPPNPPVPTGLISENGEPPVPVG